MASSSNSGVNAKDRTCIHPESTIHVDARATKEPLLSRAHIPNLNGRIHGAVKGFYEKYFPNAPRPGSVAETNQEFVGDDGLNLLSSDADIRSFFQLQSQISPVSRQSQGLDRSLKASRECPGSIIAQPTRLFRHGFYIHQGSMEPWAADRSGMYSGEVFHVPSNPERFLHITKIYSQISGTRLGISPYSEVNDGVKGCVHLVNSSPSQYTDPEPLTPEDTILKNGQEDFQLSSFELESTTISAPLEIVDDGPVCYRATRKNIPGSKFVIKFKWRRENSDGEEALLRLANKRNVWGIVQIIAHGVLGHSRPLTVRERASDDLGVPGGNRTLSWVVLHPVGKPLVEYRDTLKLLYAFRDGIRAHKSLYQQGRILHRDVSLGNILITEPENDGDPRGILIDLDVAMDCQRHNGHQAIYGDWEYDGRDTQIPPRPRGDWKMGTWRELGERKTRDMEPENFKVIMEEFRPEFTHLKALAEELRLALFPLVDGEIRTGSNTTPAAVGSLYEAMICAFDRAIASEQGVSSTSL
ncbi:hypothetical protein GGR58DRAFT_508381 [Xylaria digitata]|nr:hypothetical protein GGR58DRAFT_508381 [Xylaria digitata]